MRIFDFLKERKKEYKVCVNDVIVTPTFLEIFFHLHGVSLTKEYLM